MNNKIGLAIVVLLLINLVVMLSGFSYSQQVTNQQQTPVLTPSPTPVIEKTQPTPTPQPTMQPISSQSIVYEWHLKPEFINNATWLEYIMDDRFGKTYNSGKSWTENYNDFLSSYWVIPKGLCDSNMGVLAKAAFISYLPLDVSFDEQTGYTEASYKYSASTHYVIESGLPYLSDSRGWTKNIT